MKTTLASRSHRFLGVVFGMALALSACGGPTTPDDTGSNGNDSGQTTDSSLTDTGSSNNDGSTGGGNVAHGQTLATMTYVCNSCHDGSHGTFAGGDSIPGGNLTPDNATGLGTWTDAQVATAIRTGVAKDGRTLCATMARYNTLSDADVADLIAYLRSLPAVSHMEMACQ